eukprot:7379337-Prymnesium_polylepis.2
MVQHHHAHGHGRLGGSEKDSGRGRGRVGGVVARGTSRPARPPAACYRAAPSAGGRPRAAMVGRDRTVPGRSRTTLPRASACRCREPKLHKLLALLSLRRHFLAQHHLCC